LGAGSFFCSACFFLASASNFFNLAIAAFSSSSVTTPSLLVSVLSNLAAASFKGFA